MEKKRSSFSGGIGFVLAAAGSAVGLGNLWRFPYYAAQYGGGIFILVYIIMALTFGFALMTTEIAIGRKTKLSPIRAYQKLSSKYSIVGYLAGIVPLLILPYYCVIGGWVTKYMVASVSGEFKAAAGSTYFGEFAGSTWAPLIYFLIYLIATAVVVTGGVKNGIERVSKIMMPILLVLIVGISIYIMTLPGAWEGVKYYLLPDFSKFSFKTVCAAMGQMFFSMSLAMGIMVTYGSYTKDTVDLGKSVNQIEIFDTVVALLAGLMVVPAVYVFMPSEMDSAGVGLMFQTLPRVFVEMPGGQIIAIAFFVMVLFAALTSSISLMETLVSMVIDKFHRTRLQAVAIITGICILLGVPSSMGNGAWAHIKLLGMDFLTFFDYVSNYILMPLVALFTCVLIGWKVGVKTVEDEMIRNGEKFGRKVIYEVMVRYLAPVLLVMILVVYSLVQFGVLSM